MSDRDRLRIAVQKSGRLGDPSRELLARCGLKFTQSRDKLFCRGEELPSDLLLVRDDDVAGLIADGVCDLGIVGRNVYTEYALGSDANAMQELRALGFGACRLSLALPQENHWDSPQQLAGQRIATSYPNLLKDWLLRQGVTAQVVALSGSVEIAPRLGTADLICDLVSSGATLAANQLREVAVLLQSEAVLVAAETAPDGPRGLLTELLLRRLDGVLNASASRLLMLQAPRAALSVISDLLPGRPQPTVTSIEGCPDDIALQAVCRGDLGWQVLESMRLAGARSMLVLPMERMLA